MRRLALYVASVCLVLSLVVHVASYFGISLFEQFAFLHFGIFVLGIPAASRARLSRALGPVPALEPAWLSREAQLL